MSATPRRRLPALVGGLLALTMLTGCTAATTPKDPGRTTEDSSATTTVTTALTPGAASSSAGAPVTTATRTPASTSADPATRTPAASACDEPPCYGSPTPLGTIPTDIVPEVSGIAASSTPGYSFVVDDGTGTSSIQVVKGATVVGSVEITGMSAANAEALAPGRCRTGKPDRCLYVGDIGDHIGRDSVWVHRIPEPDPARLPDTAVKATSWEYTYDGGPVNAEALLVSDDGSLVVISKPEGDEAHRIYRAAPGGGTFALVSTFDLPKPRNPLQSIFVGNVVTDATRRADRVLLITYDQAIEYTAPRAGADPGSFPDWPHREVPMPRQPQSEALSYLPDCGYLVASEDGPIAEVNCR